MLIARIYPILFIYPDAMTTGYPYLEKLIGLFLLLSYYYLMILVYLIFYISYLDVSSSFSTLVKYYQYILTAFGVLGLSFCILLQC